MTNVMLVLIKTGVGLSANSIAVVIDAVNNLSDVLASVITLLGAKIAAKAADKKHPWGHGRIEYLSQLLVAVLIVYAGTDSAFRSAEKLYFPESTSYSAIGLSLIALSVIIKIALGRYYKITGRRVDSPALQCSGTDALMDALVSASVFVCAVFFSSGPVNPEPCVGLVISAFMLRTGIFMTIKAVDEILGTGAGEKLTSEIRKLVTEEDEVISVTRVVFHNYGPGKYIGSLRVEVRPDITASEISLLTERIRKRVFENCGVILNAVEAKASELVMLPEKK